jgi:hypothetical protein
MAGRLHSLYKGKRYKSNDSYWCAVGASVLSEVKGGAMG